MIFCNYENKRTPRSSSSLYLSRHEGFRFLLHFYRDVVSTTDVGEVIAHKLSNEPTLLIAVRCDSEAPYGSVEDVLEAFKQVNALNVQFTTRKITI